MSKSKTSKAPVSQPVLENPSVVEAVVVAPAPEPIKAEKTVENAVEKSAAESTAKPATKAPAKSATRAKTKAVQPIQPVESAAVPAAPAPEVVEVAKTIKTKKPKLVRDSFTFPESDYALIASLKLRALAAGSEFKKSEILRAGLAALQAMSDADLTKALGAVERIKTGRPSKK
ncbi:MAG: hypothetical protein RIR18_732 [Pseudomonadota bacterium]|jgi:hypothetical protein